ncbi:MAG: TCR/Tet family MFS transporter [Verrucomicrobiales bacterium]|nr:TCR/Tet family MFS transporter [Verrucomicrobiales bacterium]
MNRRPAVVFILITLFLDVLGVGLIIPILPRLIERLSGGDVSAASHTFGLLVALYSLMQFAFAPLLGSLADRFGRRPVLLFSLLGSGLDYLLLAWAPGLGWFFLARAVSGLTGASMTTATAYMADVTPPAKRAQNFGLIGATFGLGFIAGPALGGLLGDIGLRVPFLVAAGLTLLNWFYGFWVLPESLPPEHRRGFSWKRSNPVGALLALRRYPMVLGLAATFFLLHVAQTSLHSTWVLYTGHRYHWTVGQTGLSLAVVGASAMIVQGGLVRWIIPRIGEARGILIGLTISALAMAGYGLATEGWMIYVILVFGAFGGLASPSAQGLISRLVQANEQGSVQGALSSLASVAGILGPPLATGLFGYFVRPSAVVHLPGAPFFMASLLVFGALAVAARVVRPRTGQRPVG